MRTAMMEQHPVLVDVSPVQNPGQNVGPGGYIKSFTFSLGCLLLRRQM